MSRLEKTHEILTLRINLMNRRMTRLMNLTLEKLQIFKLKHIDHQLDIKHTYYKYTWWHFINVYCFYTQLVKTNYVFSQFWKSFISYILQCFFRFYLLLGTNLSQISGYFLTVLCLKITGFVCIFSVPVFFPAINVCAFNIFTKRAKLCILIQ